MALNSQWQLRQLNDDVLDTRLTSLINISLCLYLTGRLYQVEYAMEAIGHAGTCLGILANDGVLLAAERRNIHKLLDEVFFSEKIYKLNEWVNWTTGGSQRLSVLTIASWVLPFFRLTLYFCLLYVIICLVTWPAVLLGSHQMLTCWRTNCG